MKRITERSDWLEEHAQAIAIWIAIYWAVMLSLVMFCWFFGYWYNGITQGKFDLASCWQGITAVLGGFASAVSVGLMGWARFNTNAKLGNISFGSGLPFGSTLTPKAGANSEKPI